MLVIVYAYAIHLRAPFDATLVDFRTVVVLPALYPIVAVAGAGARRLLDRQAAAESALGEQERILAAQAERERLARDMHDSLAKTVHGIGFSALALSRRIGVDPEGAVDDALKLAADARTAAQEARELLSGLRGRDDAELPLPTAIRSEAARWGERTQVAVGGSLDDVGPLPSLALRELRWILKEALANVERYAHASRVDVHLRRLGDRVVLTIADDGNGFEAPDDLESLAAVGSFGLGGMRERARLAGGELSVESEPGDGTVISVWVPAGGAAPPARDARATAARRRTVRYGLRRRRGRIHLAMIRVLLVDDNAIVRRGIASLLADAQGIQVVGEAANGREAIDVARQVTPDVVCLDVRMPVMDGVAAAGPLSEKSKVLMLSYSEDEQLVTGAIRNGAAGYLVHGRFEPEELEERIKAIAKGEMVLSPAITPAVFEALRRAPGTENQGDELGLGSLTSREREVLNLLARGLSNAAIAEELVITNKTVKNHLSRIYEKIGVHSRAEAIALWLGVRER